MEVISIIEYLVPRANNTIYIVAAIELDPSPNLANAKVKTYMLLINLIVDVFEKRLRVMLGRTLLYFCKFSYYW